MDRRDEDTPSTPVTRPGNPRASSSDERDGVPCYAESDDTGKVSQALCSAMQDRDDTVTPETLLDVLVEKLSNANGNGDDPKKHADSIRAHNRLAVFMAILLGPGGALAIVYATSDRSKSNAYEVEHLKKMEPRIEKTEKEVRFIRVRVDGTHPGNPNEFVLTPGA